MLKSDGGGRLMSVRLNIGRWCSGPLPCANRAGAGQRAGGRTGGWVLCVDGGLGLLQSAAVVERVQKEII
jgi:hypothetical protein